MDDPPWEVVGIAGDVRHHGLSEPASYQVYIPVPQFYDWPLRVVLRTDDPPAAAVERIRSAASALDRSQAVHAGRGGRRAADAACSLPARRATRVDPVAALRAD